jgi:PAS domain S-box-containing protein
MSVEWQFLITLNEQLRRIRDPIEVHEVAARLLGEHLHASRVHYARIDGDEFVITRSYTDGVPPLGERGPLARFGSAIVEACRRGETVVVDDVNTDPRFTSAAREQLLRAGTLAFVGTPLIKDGRWLGTFGVHSTTPRTWTRDQIALIELTAERMWGTGERARVEEALGRNQSRQTLLQRLNDTIRPLADPARIIQETCRLLGTHLQVSRVVYCEMDGEDGNIVHDWVDDVPSMVGRVRWTSFAGSRTEEILKGWTLAVNDTSTDAHPAHERAAFEAADIRAHIAALMIRDGRFAAAFGIHSRSPRVWTPDEIALAQEVADRVWATLEHRKAEAELRANEERLAFLLRLNDVIRSLRDDAAIQDTAAQQLGEYIGATRVGFAEPDGDAYIIRHEYARGLPLAGEPVRINMGPALRQVLERGDTVVVSDVQADPRLTPDERAAFRSRQIGSYVGLGLFNEERMVATFGASHDAARVWTAREIEFVREVAQRTWDAVERTRADAVLREQKTRLKLALKASAGGSWTWDLRRNEAHWDDAFRTQFGFTSDEPARFEAWFSRVHVDDRAWLRQTFDAVLQSQDTWDNTYRILRPDGSERWMQSLGRADRGITGEVTRITGLELDVTERRKAEDALRARRDEEYDRTLRTLLETATQGIVAADPEGTLVFANQAVETMFGWTSAELIGRPIEGLIPSILRDGTPAHGGLDLVGTRKNGSAFPIDVTVNHVPTPGGGRIFAFMSDITERQQAAAALRERTAELEHRTTQLSRMAWDLTLAEHHAREEIARTLHDGLQQLLVIVALNLDLQRKRDSETGTSPSALLAQAKQHLGEAMEVARSLNVELFPPVLQHAGLPDALTWLANWTRDKYKMDVRIDADPRADSTRKDIRTLLFESVRELLFNAVKYAGTNRVTVTLALDADDQMSITVTDQGVGFEPARLDDRSQGSHMGWGLFRIRERLTLLGGRLDIDSAPGRGTRIHLVAPRETTRSAKAGLHAARPAPAGAASVLDAVSASPEALRILIVDDHPPVRRALREMLNQRPQLSVVGEASNGFEAIAQAHALHPDVILMDVLMPHMDGVEATARIRAELPGITVLGVSTLARNETADTLERAGASEFFVKGTDTQRLIEHLLALHSACTVVRTGL